MKRSAAEVLAYLRSHPQGATSRDVWLDIGCSRLAARIQDLEEAGFAIDSELITVRSGERSVRVARYRLRDAPRQLALSL